MQEHECNKKLHTYNRMRRGAAILEGTQEQFRADGYSNMLNKYGTSQDNSTAYTYEHEPLPSDMDLTSLYESNGLFAKIIDRPAEEAVKHGLDIDFGNDEIADYVEKKLDELEFEDKFSTAEKWSRLYGGAIIIMLTDDGRGLDEPLNLNDVRSIEELMVFERSVVQPDYSRMYNFNFENLSDNKNLGEPEYFQVFSRYGYFRVHVSRCLIFRNGKMPELSTSDIYRYWGIPEYLRIKRDLRQCTTSHEDGVKLLDRSVQAIYKMKNLSNLLSTNDGEDKVLQRLQVIDMARGILNSIAIDTDGEDYDFKSLPMTGVKDVIDATCNMLSAVTDIPQTILFGRSPAGMNSTGESDMENYYGMVERIQKSNMKSNVRMLINLILLQGKYTGKIDSIPNYKVKFESLWSESASEKADIENKDASTKYIKAQTIQLYMDNNVLDPSEVREMILKHGEFDISEIPEFNASDDDTAVSENNVEIDSINTAPASAVIVVKNGKILCADRSNNEGICGPGGHVESGESNEDAAVRECNEEFGIIPMNLTPLGVCCTDGYISSQIYVTKDFTGTPKADGYEMFNARWMDADKLLESNLFEPFRQSLMMLYSYKQFI